MLWLNVASQSVLRIVYLCKQKCLKISSLMYISKRLLWPFLLIAYITTSIASCKLGTIKI